MYKKNQLLIKKEKKLSKERLTFVKRSSAVHKCKIYETFLVHTEKKKNANRPGFYHKLMLHSKRDRSIMSACKVNYMKTFHSSDIFAFHCFTLTVC